MHYLLEYVKCFLSTFATTSTVLHEFVLPKDLEQLLCKTEYEFRARVSKIAYRCGNAFSLENESLPLLFGLQ